MITVERTAPLLTVQDRGRFGYLAAGVTRSGALDPESLWLANALTGNRDDAAVLEGCLGGAALRVERDVVFAITGASVTATCGSAAIEMYTAHTARAGDVINIERIVHGAIWYVAFRGGVDAPIVLGSRSTLLSAGLGGIDGGAIKTGTRLSLTSMTSGLPQRDAVPEALRTPVNGASIPLCPAPRSDALSDADWHEFFQGTFTVSHAVSRVGYRLSGPVLRPALSGDLPSEPACAGAMQLPPEGQPIVLMADHPTIGGYPYIGVVPTHALGRLAQRAPGATVRFEWQSADAALSAYGTQRDALLHWASRG